MRKLVPVLAVVLASASVAVATPASAATVARGVVARGVVTSTPQDLIAMGPITIDTSAKTFTFPTATRFDVPKEVVTAHWTGTQSLFDSAVARIERGPSLFHVFRLSLDSAGRVVATHYYYTAG